MKNFICKFCMIITLFSSIILLFHNSSTLAKESAVYVNKDLNFTIEYPKDWVQGQKYGPDNVLQVNAPNGSPDLGVSVTGLNANMDINNSPEEWTDQVKKIPGTDNFKILSKKIIILNDGTKAIKARISWTMQNMNLMTSFIAINKNKNRIRINSTGLENISFKVMEGLTDSFRFHK